MNIAYNREKYRAEQVYEGGAYCEDKTFWLDIQDRVNALIEDLRGYSQHHVGFSEDDARDAADELEAVLHDRVLPSIKAAKNRIEDFRNGEG